MNFINFRNSSGKLNAAIFETWCRELILDNSNLIINEFAFKKYTSDVTDIYEILYRPFLKMCHEQNFSETIIKDFVKSWDEMILENPEK